MRKLAAIWYSVFVLLSLICTTKPFSIYGRDQDDSNDEMETNNDENGDAVTQMPLEYNADMFEGDILLHERPDGVSEEGVKQSRRWQNGIIPYQVDDSFSTEQKNMISAAIREIEQKTCIQFRPKRASDNDYVDIYPGDDGCYSNVGHSKGKGRHELSLSKDGCFISGTIRHELMHTIGFYHEQARTDRDEYVDIIFENIPRDSWGQFEKSNVNEVTDLGTEYDFGSVMHYKENAFAIDKNRPTIVAKEGGKKFGQREGFSATDLYEIRKLYGCSIDVIPTHIPINPRREGTRITPRNGGSITVKSRNTITTTMNPGSLGITQNPDRYIGRIQDQCENLDAENKLFLNDRCYVVSKEKVEWKNAAKGCTHITSGHKHLAFPADRTTIDQLYMWLLDDNDELMNTQGFYVGAYQFRSSPPPHRADVGWSWFLKDGNKVRIPALPSTYIWRPGQPNDHGGNIDERAAAIVRSGGLDDVSADLELPYICEYSD